MEAKTLSLYEVTLLATCYDCPARRVESVLRLRGTDRFCLGHFENLC